MRGQVWRANLQSSLTRGGVQVHPRPVVILSADATYARHETALVVVGTSNQKAIRFPHSAGVAASRGNGLAQDTVFLCHQVQVIPKDWLTTQFGQLSVADLDAVSAATRSALGL